MMSIPYAPTDSHLREHAPYRRATATDATQPLRTFADADYRLWRWATRAERAEYLRVQGIDPASVRRYTARFGRRKGAAE